MWASCRCLFCLITLLPGSCIGSQDLSVAVSFKLKVKAFASFAHKMMNINFLTRAQHVASLIIATTLIKKYQTFYFYYWVLDWRKQYWHIKSIQIGIDKTVHVPLTAAKTHHGDVGSRMYACMHIYVHIHVRWTNDHNS